MEATPSGPQLPTPALAPRIAPETSAEPGRHLLVVAHDPSARRALAAALVSENGCDVETAKDAAEALVCTRHGAALDLAAVEFSQSSDGAAVIAALRQAGVRAPVL